MVGHGLTASAVLLGHIFPRQRVPEGWKERKLEDGDEINTGLLVG